MIVTDVSEGRSESKLPVSQENKKHDLNWIWPKSSWLFFLGEGGEFMIAQIPRPERGEDSREPFLYSLLTSSKSL